MLKYFQFSVQWFFKEGVRVPNSINQKKFTKKYPGKN